MPGGIFALTLNPRRFLDFVAQQALRRKEIHFKLRKLLRGDPMTGWEKALASFGGSVEQLRRRFDTGEIAYMPTDAGKYREARIYGDAVVPLSYVGKGVEPVF
jgi:hypothetical protein